MAVAIVGFAVAPAARAQSAPADLYLEVVLDDRSSGIVSHVVQSAGTLFIQSSELRRIGVAVPGGSDLEDEWTSLDAVPGLAHRYDVPTQRLILDAPPSLRPVQTYGVRESEAVEVRTGSGWLLTYDAYGRESEDASGLGVVSTLRRFGPFGAIEQTGTTRAVDDATGYQRLETHWTYSDPDRMSTWTAGDLVTGGLSWTRPVRMGGLQWRRNFGVRPDLITIPVPRLSGDATVPSTVDVYLNNVRQFSESVREGPFVFDLRPQIDGAGLASLVVSDALGRTTEARVPLYVDHRLLAPGLTDFSVQVGVLRMGFAGEGDAYDSDPVAVASARRGLTDHLTIEAHTELGPGLRLAGLGAQWTPFGRWGLVSASLVGSGGRANGTQYSLGYRWTGARVAMDIRTIRRSSRYGDLGDRRVGSGPATSPGSLATERSQMTLGAPIKTGRVSLNWLEWKDASGARHRTRGVSWTQIVRGRVSLSASVFDDSFGGTGGALSVGFGFGRGLDATLTAGHDRRRSSGSTVVRQSAPYDGGWGWSARGGRAPDAYAQVAGEVRGSKGRAWAAVDRSEGRTSASAQASGSVVWMAGRLIASRSIHDSFALVSTSGRAGVPVLRENRPYGQTDIDGYLLVTDVRGWQSNRIAIDSDGFAVSDRLGALEQRFVPMDRGGVVVHFDIQRGRPALVTLVGPDGSPVPVGTRARWVGTGRPLIVGFDGETYIDDLSEGAVIELHAAGIGCVYEIPPAPALDRDAGVELELGPFICRAHEP